MFPRQRLVGIFSFVVAVGMIVAACGPAATPAPTLPPSEATPTSVPAEPTAPPAKEVTLTFPSWQQDEPGTSQWWKARIADFEESHPGVTIEFNKVPLGDLVDTLTTQFAAGTPPQIVHLPALNFAQFAAQGWLQPLDSYLEGTDILETYTSLQDSCKYEGKTQCILLFLDHPAMVYNEKLLEEAGVEVPTTPEEFLAAARAITKPPDQYGSAVVTSAGWNMMWWVNLFVVGAGGVWTKDGKPVVNTPEVIQGLEWWKELVTSGSSPSGIESGEIRHLFLEGKIGMFFDGPWWQGFMPEAAPDVKPYIKTAQMPFKYIEIEASDVIAMPAAIPDDEKQLVWEFIESLTTPEAQVEYAMVQGAGPPREDITLPAELLEEFPIAGPWLELPEDKVGVDWYPKGLEAFTSEFIDLISEAGQKMLTQDMSAEQAAAELQAALEALQQ